jgi:hypothetical protein
MEYHNYFEQAEEEADDCDTGRGDDAPVCEDDEVSAHPTGEEGDYA